MNYYISVKYTSNCYNALKLYSIAIVSGDNRELSLERITPKRSIAKIEKFCNDGTEIEFYSYVPDFQFVAFCNLFDGLLPSNYPSNFRDLNFLEDYISGKVGSDFSVWEDSNFPIPKDDMTHLENARWMKKLHEFLIDFESRTLNAEDLVVKIEPKSSYKYNATKTENY